MTYDVIVIGGGTAGLSGALVLARSRRSVLVLDAGSPRNAPAAHSHNYLTRDGAAPDDLLAAGRDEIKGYGAEIRSATVISAFRNGQHFELGLDDGSTVAARRVLVAAGVIDELPDVPGVQELWGKHVLHCPYCHGWEVRDRGIGILASSPLAFHAVQLWRQLSGDVTLFLNDAITPDEQQRAEARARGIRLVEGRVAALEVDGDALTGVRLEAGDVVPVQELVVQSFARARVFGLEGLGLTIAEQSMGELVLGTMVAADPMTGAAVGAPGVFVAGNAAAPMETLVGSAAAGVKAGAMLNADLVTEDLAAAG